MSDRIALKGISAKGFHGVLDFEKRDGQTFVVDVEMEVDLAPAGASDDLVDTVNYAEVAGDVVDLIQGASLDLIEALADQIAAKVLTRPLVEAVAVTVHKPQAPVGHPFTDVAVTVERVRETPVVIAVGSNMGDSLETIQNAVGALWLALELKAASRVYETAPVGGPAQAAYLNAVLVGTTSMSPQRLLRTMQDIELEHGRVRKERWGPRTLDLDLIQYGDPVFDTDVRMETEALTLPHPRAHERAFVLVPWADADPEAALRVDGEVRRVAELAAELGTSGVTLGPDVDLMEDGW
ncbi:2-amino-4-hydroxy-6-hydroxymethyldihydropteridine diphosphokinase [Knoellia subterranea]|uniref:Bifunctional folate synthesis protein n=1 Tax=Knoellia subterranea KCTC 19937 TaxID=1385521 RepID=A0A0A0JRD7_9MICO|nr:2-amino-4-hydroxy-6-hydroxymethyldihydropteridine diphosphokinase [Knoellia subterranea]KGN38151.1 SulD [Knoellia subterranea KCTC 19937]